MFLIKKNKMIVYNFNKYLKILQIKIEINSFIINYAKFEIKYKKYYIYSFFKLLEN